MTADLKVHQGKKGSQDEFAEAILFLTKGLKDQGFTDDYILSFVEMWSKIYTAEAGTVIGYAEM